MSVSRRAARQAPGASHGTTGRDRWLLSYGDFMTLLLALFVVLYASARIEAGESDALLEGLRTAFLFEGAAPTLARETPDETAARLARNAIVPPTPLAQLESDLERELEAQRRLLGDELGASLQRDERGLVVTLASAEFFPAGGVAIPEPRRRVLAAMAPLFAANRLPLHFEGHTDASPIENEAYPSNWELSTARAAAVARFFIEQHQIDPRRVATTGYAEFRPIVANDDASARARNRRVEIVVLEDGELVPTEGEGNPGERAGELSRLLEALPPIPDAPDERFRAPDPGPPPADAPLP